MRSICIEHRGADANIIRISKVYEDTCLWAWFVPEHRIVLSAHHPRRPIKMNRRTRHRARTSSMRGPFTEFRLDRREHNTLPPYGRVEQRVHDEDVEQTSALRPPITATRRTVEHRPEHGNRAPPGPRTSVMRRRKCVDLEFGVRRPSTTRTDQVRLRRSSAEE